MEYLAIIYVAGLGVMLLGLIASRDYKKPDARVIPTIAAYILWPISVLALLLNLAWTKLSQNTWLHTR